jgi:uncharacterized membrane protein YpjA
LNRSGTLSFLLSKPFMLNRRVLWPLFWVNALGTVYGYQWYAAQLVETVTEISPYLVIFVPDSPTASLFFTLSILFLLIAPREPEHGRGSFIRGLIEALAVITSVKYGIWAVAMILAGSAQGDPLVWQDWMLMFSHAGMAVEAVLYGRFFRKGWIHVAAAACWTLLSDVVDYTFGVFPYLPRPLYDDLGAVQLFTIALSVLGIATAYVLYKKYDTKQV